MRDDYGNSGSGQDLDQKFDTKIELFKVNTKQEEQQRKVDQLIGDPEKSEQALQETENLKTYQTLLQSQLLKIDNASLLSELKNNDENFLVPNQYVQMQIQNDCEPIQI